MIFSNLVLKSFLSFAKHKIAISSLATVIQKESFLSTPFLSPIPILIFLKVLSLISSDLFHNILSGFIFNSFPMKI